MEETLYFLLGLCVAIAVVMLRHRFASFSGQSPDDYAHLSPEFDLRHHLSGDIQCDGVIYGPGGQVTSRFTADMKGTWDGNKGILTQRFYFDDDERQDRIWHLELANNGEVRALAEDVIGFGAGWQCGPSVQMKYKIRLPAESGGYVLNVVDWMYLVDQSTIMNRSQFRKYGIKVAELVATMRPKDKT